MHRDVPRGAAIGREIGLSPAEVTGNGLGRVRWVARNIRDFACEGPGPGLPSRIGTAEDARLGGGENHRAIGGHSEDEHFSSAAHLSRHLGESTAETCNTYNMLKLTRRLFLRDADPARVDFYERGLFNHILPSQDPETGMVIYYCPLRPGA